MQLPSFANCRKKIAILVICTLVGALVLSSTANISGLSWPSKKVVPTKSMVPPEVEATIHQQPQYSWHQCLRDHLHASDRSCHFKHVCLEWRSRKFFYFRPEFARDYPLKTNKDVTRPANGLEETIFREQPYIATRKADLDTGVTPQVVLAKIPTDSLVVWLDYGVLFDAFWPENFGHALGDDFFPAWRIAKTFNVLTKEVHFVHPFHSCDSYSPSDLHCQQYHKLLPLVTNNEPLKLGVGKYENNTVCFGNLLVGTSTQGITFDTTGTTHVFSQFYRWITTGICRLFETANECSIACQAKKTNHIHSVQEWQTYD